MRRHARRHQLVRILIAQLIQAERATPRDVHGALQQLVIRRVPPRDLVARPQVPFRIRQQPPPRRRERAFLANARQHILQIAPLGHVVVHIVRGHER
ncbi:MAG TPA: hypothetical protein PLQ87_01820 [Phycisphaerae bacterium]|nr:hypothetical protein [Phycisphaerae bacterium]